jgi:hypothetical protein
LQWAAAAAADQKPALEVVAVLRSITHQFRFLGLPQSPSVQVEAEER